MSEQMMGSEDFWLVFLFCYPEYLPVSFHDHR